jgi:hypothetical protein
VRVGVVEVGGLAGMAILRVIPVFRIGSTNGFFLRMTVVFIQQSLMRELSDNF